MIEFSDFYREYKEDIRTQNSKIDKLVTSINDLCTRTTLNEDHVNKVIDEKVKSKTDKQWIITTLIGSIAMITVAINVWKTFFS